MNTHSTVGSFGFRVEDISMACGLPDTSKRPFDLLFCVELRYNGERLPGPDNVKLLKSTHKIFTGRELRQREPAAMARTEWG
jgi:hypothetical protein